MKKITTLFTLLLLCAVTAMAQTTTVTLAYTAEPFKKNATQGTMPSGYGSFNGQTYTTNATSGLAGLTVTASSGLTIGEERVNVDYYGDCFKFETAAASTNYTVSISAPDGYVVVGYYLACSANTSQATHTLTATNGTTVVASAPNAQGNVTKKFTVFGLNEQTTSFTINTANKSNKLYVPTFTVTLAPAGSVVSSVNDLSNTKQYVVMCERGVLNTSNGSIGTSAKNNLAAKNFAIVNYNSNYYFWSVDDAKFVASSTSLETYPTEAAMTPQYTTNSSATNPLFKFLFDANRLNTNANGVVINNYNTDDGGNSFLIIANGDFNDMATVEERFLDLTPYRDALQAAINTANGLPVGEGPNKYTVTGGLDDLNAAVAAGETELNKDESEQTKTSLVDACTAIETALSNLTMTLNLPQAGFYRIKGSTSGKYVGDGNSTVAYDSNQYKFTMSTATDATTIFYYDGTNLISFETGKCANIPDWGWKYGNDDVLTAVTFVDGLSNGGYAIKNGVDKNNNPIYLYDKGDESVPHTDRGAMASITTSTNARYTNWYLEAVTELPITLRSTDGENYFATFSAPVNVRISDAALNRVEKKTKTASYTAVDTDELPAGVGVLLTGITSSATATIITNEVAPDNYGLESYYAATAGTGDETKLYLGKGKNSGKAGFYKLGEGTTSNGFKAYLEDTAAASGEAKEGFELVFGGEVTGVETIDNGQWTIDNSAVFNLQGQRVNKAQKGVYIQNGKKVVLK